MKNLMKVVLADADEGFRMMLQRVIEAAGDFKVAGSTGNGADAWRIIERECPQLVIMDVLLPELDGFVLLNRLAPWRRGRGRYWYPRSARGRW